MILLGLLVLAVVSVATYELWRRGGPAREGEQLDAIDPPPHILGNDADADADGDGGDGGGDA